VRAQRHAGDDYRGANARERDLIMNVAYPYAIDVRGRTATADDADHLRQLIEQVLFTAPGERVNRPTFGSGLMELVFAPNNDALAAAVQASAYAALQEWLGDRIEVTRLDVVSEDARLEVTVGYTVRRTDETRVEQFARTR
jgi:phage baseplate assembly protein W